MNVHYNFRNTTATLPTTAPSIRRATTGNRTPRWVGPLALAAVSVAAIVTVNQIRSDGDPTPVTPSLAQAEPWVGPEEQAFIDARTTPVSRAVAAPRSVSQVEPWVGAEERAFIDARTTPVSRAVAAPRSVSQVEPWVGAEERAFIDARTTPVSASVASGSGFESWVGAEERAFIDARTTPVGYPRGVVTDWCIAHRPC